MNTRRLESQIPNTKCMLVFQFQMYAIATRKLHSFIMMINAIPFWMHDTQFISNDCFEYLSIKKYAWSCVYILCVFMYEIELKYPNEYSLFHVSHSHRLYPYST